MGIENNYTSFMPSSSQIEKGPITEPVVLAFGHAIGKILDYKATPMKMLAKKISEFWNSLGESLNKTTKSSRDLSANESNTRVINPKEIGSNSRNVSLQLPEGSKSRESSSLLNAVQITILNPPELPSISDQAQQPNDLADEGPPQAPPEPPEAPDIPSPPESPVFPTTTISPHSVQKSDSSELSLDIQPPEETIHCSGTEDDVNELQQFTGDTLHLEGPITEKTLIALKENEGMGNVKKVVLYNCSKLKVSATLVKNMQGAFPNLSKVEGVNTPGLKTLQAKIYPEAAAKIKAELFNAEFESQFKQASMLENPDPQAYSKIANEVMIELTRLLRIEPLNQDRISDLIDQLGRLQRASVIINSTGINDTDRRGPLENVVGTKIIAIMTDANVSQATKQALWKISEKNGHPLHNAAVGKLEQLFSSTVGDDKELSRNLEKAYTQNLKQMFAGKLEAESVAIFGKPADETLNERTQLQSYWNRNTTLGRVWRNQSHETSYVHPSYWGLFMLAPHTQEETTSLQQGLDMPSTGKKSPFKHHPEIDPTQKGIEIFGGEGHTRDYYLRISGVETYSTKGTGLDLAEPDDSSYYDGMLKPINLAKLRTAQETGGKMHTMLIQKGDAAHETVGFGDLSMAPKDFGNFNRKLETAKSLGTPYKPLTKALAKSIAVVSMPRTAGLYDLLPEEITSREEMPTQIVTVANAETSRRLHRLEGKKDQYRHQTLERTTMPSFVDWNIDPSNLGIDVKKGDLICTLKELTPEDERQYKMIKDAGAERAKAFGELNNINDPGRVKRKVLEQESESDYEKIMSLGKERRVLAPEDGVIFLSQKDGGLPSELEKDEVLFSRKDLGAELKEWSRVTGQLGIETPELYLKDLPEESQKRVKIAFALTYNTLGSMGVFLQEGDSTGQIGDSFEARNISIAVRDADEWGKGQLRQVVNKENGEVQRVVTLTGKDISDLNKSLTSVLDSSGLGHEIDKEPKAKKFVGDVQKVQSRLTTVTTELFGSPKIDTPIAMYAATTKDELLKSMGHRMSTELSKPESEQSDLAKALNRSGVTFAAIKNTEEQIYNARQKDVAEPRTDGKTYVGELFNDGIFYANYQEATAEFKKAMIMSFKNYVAEAMTGPMEPLANLFKVIDGKGSYLALSNNQGRQ